MLNHFQNRQFWIESLYKDISEKFSENKYKKTYSKELPFQLKKIVNKEELPDYGNPIKWIFSGVAGVNAFIVGDIFEDNNLLEDLSEKNFYPPLLTKELNALGEEYMYSQIAIILVSQEVSEKTQSWLNQWRDDPRYFRKILITVSTNETPEDIGRNIRETFLTPWDSIKSSELNESPLELFEKIEEDDEE
ncbi:hypothetical protein [Exiguobacterium aurantiacum]|uniref:Uncharacterized protein n=1 Tax=Exiguobacterium aurantiacum TaxID=33987 RepID=A0A377FWR2_9BACL|nr:hypothetical protein [Exiguobacterium aurantiacum]STO09270.1 Uncharacterised protein [Exiguobacterium aurantiacum]